MKSLDLDFTRGCNMNCIHCFADAHTVMPGELTTEQYKDVLDQAKAWAPLSRVSWGLGGEALTRRDIFELLEYGKALGYPQVLTTNGLLVTEEVARKIAATEARVSISIDGATDETHEKLRLIPGSLQKAIRGIKRLKAAGAHVGANVTLTKHNVHELPQLLQLAKDLELDHLSLGNIMPFGRALANPELILEEEELAFVMKTAQEHNDMPMPVSAFDGTLELVFNARKVLEAGRFQPKVTSAGRGKVVVRPDGEVWPCQLLPMPAGNVKEQPLSEILQSPVFDEVLEVVEEQEVQKNKGCGGGCVCTYIMNNESDEWFGAAKNAWENVTLSVPDDLGKRVKERVAAKRGA